MDNGVEQSGSEVFNLLPLQWEFFLRVWHPSSHDTRNIGQISDLHLRWPQVFKSAFPTGSNLREIGTLLFSTDWVDRLCS